HSLARLFLFRRYGHHRDLHSFPPRRSSDLPRCLRTNGQRVRSCPTGALMERVSVMIEVCGRFASRVWTRARRPDTDAIRDWRSRSEEHTSELQSRENLVCRLLLEKKKCI